MSNLSNLSIEKFEAIFGNTPFQNIKKIEEYIEENFVSLEEYNLLLKRFRHLIKSKIISSYDEVNNKGKYIKNIDTFDIDYISKDELIEIGNKYEEALKKLNKKDDINRIKAFNERLMFIQELLLKELGNKE